MFENAIYKENKLFKKIYKRCLQSKCTILGNMRKGYPISQVLGWW